MAGIDKTYVNAQQLKEAIAWAKEVGTVTMENGHKFKPLNYIYGYNDFDNVEFNWNREEYILWNTPRWFDRWLWLNCPLSFVKERLKQQYDENDLKEFENYVYHNPKDNLDFGKQHYTFIKTPKGRDIKWWMSHGRKENPWPDKCIQLNYMMEINAPRNDKYDFTDDLDYNAQTDTWEKSFGMQPTTPWIDGDYVWQRYHKRIPNKKSIIRELRRWYIPKGYTVRLYNLKYKGFDFEILVK